jgi:hypothetical protein
MDGRFTKEDGFETPKLAGRILPESAAYSAGFRPGFWNARAMTWLKSLLGGFFFFFFGPGWRAFFSSWSDRRCALSAFVRFSAMFTVSHGVEPIASPVDFKLHHYPGSLHRLRDQECERKSRPQAHLNFVCERQNWTMGTTMRRYTRLLVLRNTSPPASRARWSIVASVLNCCQVCDESDAQKFSRSQLLLDTAKMGGPSSRWNFSKG